MGALFILVLSGCLLEFDPALLDGGACQGCLDGVSCLGGDQPSACGADGETCQVCAAPTPACVAGRCAVESAVISLAAGASSTLAVDAGGRLWAWGDNAQGKLGIPGAVDPSTPQLVSSAGWARVAVGGDGGGHACAIANDGSLWCWGNDADGQLGLGQGVTADVPTRVGELTDWTSIAAGRASTCGVRAGALSCWGWNGDDRLGVVDLEGRSEPYVIDAKQDWAAVALTYAHACAIRMDATLWCWGANDSGELGRGGDNAPPALVGTAATSWTKVVAGTAFSCGLRGGALFCWGANDSGQTGLSTAADMPTKVGTETDWRDVSAGGRHACGVKQSGELYCWGANDFGQIGSTTVENAPAPERVGDRSDWVDVEAGNNHTCGVVESGLLLCFGSNGHGELGIGDVSSSLAVPSEVTIAE